MNDMDVEQQLADAATLPSEEEVVVLRQLVRSQAKEHDQKIQAQEQMIAELVQTVELLKHELGQLKKQLFGQKSEKQKPTPNENDQQDPPTDNNNQSNRGKAKTQRDKGHVSDKGLRFRASAQIINIDIPVPAEDGVEIIGYETIHRVAQRPAATVVLAYKIPIVKSATGSLIPTWAPNQLFEGSYADVSFIAGMLVDKFMYHLPLYRQHQRLQSNGIDLARSTLTLWAHRSIELLRPIYDAQINSILGGQIIEMDETPIKASRKVKGKMHTGYFWPILGDQQEIAFMYANTRATSHIETVLRQEFTGTLLTDGYGAYQAYASANQELTHANCWVHWRRKFDECKKMFPEESAVALEKIGELYKLEDALKEQQQSETKKGQMRLEKSKPLVDDFFQWCHDTLSPTLSPKNPLRKAIQYGLNRESQLRVFLEDPALPLDTNAVERQIRPIKLGKNNWMFCWTELGAEHVGIIQSLVASCKMQKIDPYTYLVDVLLRVGKHPASKVHELMPRHWKQLFEGNPFRSDLWGKGQ